MRSILVVSLMLLSVAPLGAQGARPPESTRGRVIAALEQLMITGRAATRVTRRRSVAADGSQRRNRPWRCSTSRGLRSARRFRSSRVQHTPVSTLGNNPPVTIEMPVVLTLPTPVTYRADLFASVDGGELVPAGTVSSVNRERQSRLVAAAVRKEGRTSPHQAARAHHLRALYASGRDARPSRDRLRDLRS